MSKKKIVLGILAHVDAGKTTLSEAMLYSCKTIRSLGRVDHRDTFLDTDEIERERGITVLSKEARLSAPLCDITLLDTPGHVDFSAETERTLMVADAAILLVSAIDGVQSHTRTLWRLLNEYKIPCFIFVNKMDIASRSEEDLLDELKTELSDGCVRGSFSGEKELEELALCSEQLLEEYSLKHSISEESLEKAVSKREVFPVVFGSALKQQGVDELLDVIGRLALPVSFSKEFGARVYKISRDKSGNRLTHLRIMGGELANRQELNDEKVTGIRIYNGEKFEAVTTAGTGEVVCVLGLTNSRVRMGYGVCEEERPAYLAPVLSYRVNPPSDVSAVVLFEDMKLLEEEDPSLSVEWLDEVKEVHLSLMGAVQLEVITERIKSRFGFVVTFDSGRILYKETITNTVEGIGHFEPLRHYAEAHILLSPGDEGSGITIDNECSVDELGRQYQKLILTHIGEREHRGVLTGSPVTDIHFTVIGGRSHNKHTEGGDFRQAVYRAIRQGLRKAKSVLLEPYYEVTLTIPMDYVGRAMTDFSKMNGHIEAPIIEDNNATLYGEVPVSCVGDYAREVAAYTGGSGRISFSLGGYRPCHNASEVIEQRGYDPEADLRNPTSSVFCGHGAGFQVPWYEVDDMAHVPPIDYDDPVIDGEHVREVIRAARQEAMPADESEIGQMLTKKERKNVSRVLGSYTGYTGMDAELEAIFVREFGPIASPIRDNDISVRDYDSEKQKRQQDARDDYFSSHKNAVKKPEKPKEKVLIVDGYNVIFAWKDTKELAKKNMDGARGVLLDAVSNYAGYTGERVIVVFDAYLRRDNPGVKEIYNNINVVYTKQDETADAYIEKTAHELSGKVQLRVVTSDRNEQDVVMGSGALRMSSAEFYEEVKRVSKQGMEAPGSGRWEV
ncbi:MAG: TetM/TetW/TetO/TetS family tetracycline resistance ribosomal protection protein [Lachnospiraceae bacterium]|nr:TetM/TetW/TetO/TetS family tetracycline resistance ribosomal protection protein [Lachnospiraceae bacterium]